MAIITKPKIKIQKKIYYWFLCAIFVYVLASTIYLLSALIINTKIFDHIQDIQLKNDSNIKWMAGKIISYVINIILCLIFLLYLSLGRFRINLGFIFITIWIIVFITLAIAMHILPGAHDEVIRFTMGIISTLASLSIIVGLLFLGYELMIRRRMKRKEMYKIFKQQRK